MADIMGVNGCSFESLLAAVSESFESLLLLLLLALLFELPAPFEFELLSLFELDDEDDEPPPTRFWMNSCSRPHSACLTGTRQAARHSEQATSVASRMGPSLVAAAGVLFVLRAVFILRLLWLPVGPLVGVHFVACMI
jgi:hypothetical protein